MANPHINKEDSATLPTEATSTDAPLRRILFRARNHVLPTRDRLCSYLTRAAIGGFTSAFLRRIEPLHQSPLCPNNCGQPETHDHLASCPTTATIRNQADDTIASILREAGYNGPPIRWLQDPDLTVSPFDRLCGYIPAARSRLVATLPTSRKRLILNIQRVLAHCLLQCWRHRCAVLHDRNPPHSTPARALPPLPIPPEPDPPPDRHGAVVIQPSGW